MNRTATIERWEIVIAWLGIPHPEAIGFSLIQMSAMLTKEAKHGE